MVRMLTLLYWPKISLKWCALTAALLGAMLLSQASLAQHSDITQGSQDAVSSALGFASLSLADDKRVHYAYAGAEQPLGILFVHGTPGSWSAFEDYLRNAELQQRYFMVSVDRLGWGESRLAGGGVESDFVQQSKAIVAVMQQYPAVQWIVVGHSLGASLAPQIALTAPQKVAALVLLAGSLDPQLGKARWYNKLATSWLIKPLIGRQLRRSNAEIMPLSGQLSRLESMLKERSLDTRMTIVQGGKDRLVSPKNAAYAQSQWLGAFSSVELIELPDAGHFIPWQQSAVVISAIHAAAKDIPR